MSRRKNDYVVMALVVMALAIVCGGISLWAKLGV